MSYQALTDSRYLQDLQKQVEQQRHQSSPSNSIFEPVTQTVNTPLSYRSPALAQISSAPPPYRPSLDAASLRSQAPQPSYCPTPISQSQLRASFSPRPKRNSDVAFGSETNNGECGIDNSLAYPALTADTPQQSDSVNKVPSSSNHQPAGSPLSIWPSAFTIPSQIIKNTRKNRRTWSKYPEPSLRTSIDAYRSMAGSLVDMVFYSTPDAYAGQ